MVAVLYPAQPVKPANDDYVAASDLDEDFDDVDDPEVLDKAKAAFVRAFGDDADDSEHIVDVFNLAPTDSVEVMLAKSMFSRMIFDMMAMVKPEVDEPDIYGRLREPTRDIFGQVKVTRSKADRAQMRKYDALIWMYGFNPEPAQITFEWVCKILDLCPDLIRRITARSARMELSQILGFLAGMVSPRHAQMCEEEMSDYVNLTGWNRF